MIATLSCRAYLALEKLSSEKFRDLFAIHPKMKRWKEAEGLRIREQSTSRMIQSRGVAFNLDVALS